MMVTLVSMLVMVGLRPELVRAVTTASIASFSEPRACLGNLDAETVVQSLDRIGFAPNALAAAGVTSEEAGVVAVALASALEAEPTELDRRDEGVGALRAAVETSRRAVQAGTADSILLDTFAAQSAALAAAESARAGRIDELRAVAAAGLSADVQDRLSSVLDQAELWIDVPEPYRLSLRPEPQMLHLREALTRERHALENSVDLDPETAAFLAAVRQEPGIDVARVFPVRAGVG
jgi:hypothetical protein